MGHTLWAKWFPFLESYRYRALPKQLPDLYVSLAWLDAMVTIAELVGSNLDRARSELKAEDRERRVGGDPDEVGTQPLAPPARRG